MPAYGRGGAGNIEAATALPRAKTPDVEKAADELDARTNLATYAGTAHDALHNQQYAHMGRGGAGNYYSPWELQMRGEFTGAGTSHVLGDGTPQPKSQETERMGDKGDMKGTADTGVTYRGRGGAGNFSFGVSESEERATRKRLEEEQRKKEELRVNSEKIVEEGLARPEKAKMPLGEGI